MDRDATYATQRHRKMLAAWPAGPVPVPPTEGRGWSAEVVEAPSLIDDLMGDEAAEVVEAYSRIDAEGEVLLVHRAYESFEDQTPLPEEWVLRELPQLDLDDPAMLVSLTEQYGPVVDLDDPLRLLPRDIWPQIRESLVDAQRKAGGVNTDPEEEPPTVRGVAVEVVRRHLAILQAFTKHVVAYQRHRKLATSWNAADFLDVFHAPGTPPKATKIAHSAEEAWSLFVRLLNPALQDFSPYVTHTDRTGYEETRWELGRQPPLYAIAALQIFNILIEGLPILTCANENCPRLFQRQEGRSVSGRQRRTSGVLFCSYRCADAQGQRDRRRRLKSEMHDAAKERER